MNMKQSCKALICAIEGELDGRHCTQEQAAAILDHALPSLTEALARVEAERDAERARGDAAVGDANEAEAKLAEAVGLLRELELAYKHVWYEPHIQEVDTFLARHAQAEQQEAQGAQAGDERTAFEDFFRHRITDNRGDKRFSRSRLTDIYLDDEVREMWSGWRHRAALATQPAVPVEYPAGAIENGRTLMGRLEQWYTFADDQGHAIAMCKEWLDLKECFEHMADSLKAVRGAEHE